MLDGPISARGGAKPADLCRKYAMSDATRDDWQAAYDIFKVCFLNVIASLLRLQSNIPLTKSPYFHTKAENTYACPTGMSPDAARDKSGKKLEIL